MLFVLHTIAFVAAALAFGIFMNEMPSSLGIVALLTLVVWAYFWGRGQNLACDFGDDPTSRP